MNVFGSGFGQCTAARSSRAPRRARGRLQHRRDGIIAPTTPMHLVRIKLELLGRNSRKGSLTELQVRCQPDGRARRFGARQKMPSAAFASSDIISGLQAGRRTISGRTSVTPGTCDELLHLLLDERPDRTTHRRERVRDIDAPIGRGLHLVDEAEIDDVDAQLGVVDVAKRLQHRLLVGRLPAVRRCRGIRLRRSGLGQGRDRRVALMGDRLFAYGDFLFVHTLLPVGGPLS